MTTQLSPRLKEKTFKIKVVADMLGTSVDTVRRVAEEAKLTIQRQASGPLARQFTVENIYDIAAHMFAKPGVRTKRGTKIFTFYAPKGGVGKTTGAANVAAHMPLLGLKVLVIDVDFQGNLTLAYGYDPELTLEEAQERGLPESRVVSWHFGNLMPEWEGPKPTSLAEVIKKPFGENGPHIIPADIHFDQLEDVFTLAMLRGKQPDKFIGKLLHHGMSGKDPAFDLSSYDVIIFDAAPSKNAITRGALLASDFVVAPVAMEKFSTKSVSYLSRVLTDLNTDFGKFPELALLGNFFDPLKLRVATQKQAILRHYEKNWLDVQISSSEEFKKVLSSDDPAEDGVPLVLARPTSKSADEIRQATIALAKKAGLV